MQTKRLSEGTRKYIRRQKMLIKRTAKNEDERNAKTKELLSRFYKKEEKDTKFDEDL